MMGRNIKGKTVRGNSHCQMVVCALFGVERKEKLLENLLSGPVHQNLKLPFAG